MYDNWATVTGTFQAQSFSGNQQALSACLTVD